jgi:hypothetical protein
MRSALVPRPVGLAPEIRRHKCEDGAKIESGGRVQSIRDSYRLFLVVGHFFRTWTDKVVGNACSCHDRRLPLEKA